MDINGLFYSHVALTILHNINGQVCFIYCHVALAILRNILNGHMFYSHVALAMLHNINGQVCFIVMLHWPCYIT